MYNLNHIHLKSKNPETTATLLFPGSYFLRVEGNTTTPTSSYTMSFDISAPDTLGSFAAGDAIADIVSGALAQGSVDSYVIEFTTPVTLSGVLDANEAGAGADDPDIDLSIRDQDGSVLTALSVDDPDPFGPTDLDAGLYVIDVRGFAAADNYTVSLTVDPQD